MKAKNAHGTLTALFSVVTALLWICPRAFAADGGAPAADAYGLYLRLARLAREAYEEDNPDIVTTPAGNAALVRLDEDGVLVIAFRGSMVADRDPERKPFSNFGGRVMRRNYRDWAATNLKQTAGFLPRQYVEAAALVAEQMRAYPRARRIFVTGHSKGGGAAAYAAVGAWLDADVDRAQKRKLAAVTFNAAVVRERNWRRLFREHAEQAVRELREGGGPPITAVVMRDDPVSKIGQREQQDFVRVRVLEPSRERPPLEQHGIDVVIEELTRLAGGGGR